MKLRNVLFITLFLIPGIGLAQVLGSNNMQNKWEKEGNIVDSSDFIGTINTMPLIFRSNDIEQMRITTKGNVGIGVDNPTKRLEVNGPTLLNGDLFLPKLDTVGSIENINEVLFIDEEGKVFKGGVNALKQLVYTNPFPENPSNGICGSGIPQQNPSWMSSPYKLYTLCPDIKVGIGTDSPTETLDVNGSAKMRSATITNQLLVGRNTSLTGMIVGNYFGSSTDPYGILDLKFTNQQNITTPVLKLMPNGQLSLNGHFTVKNAGNEEYISLINTTTGTKIFTVDENGDLRLKNSNRTVFYVDAAQETVRARKIVVDEQNWPDYVFQKDYRLPTLKEVGTFIKINNHLPNIPSREEVKKNGVDLGGIVKKLTQKVEELTLYTIQQQKEIELLKKLLKQEEKRQ